MRFLFFMNMPSGAYDGPIAHQVIGDVDVESMEEMHDLVSEEKFISIKLMFYDRRSSDRNGDRIWQDKGEMLLNTDHIGKIMVYAE
jgi:hypothetical protein